VTDERTPILVADAGPLMRLAAAGLLPGMRGLNRQIVLVDRVEDEVIGDLSKPFARDVADWLMAMGPAIIRAKTAIGIGVETLRAKARTAEEDAILKSSLRDSGELALREFLDRWRPTTAVSAIVLYEDRKVPPLFLGADYPLTLMTTRMFARRLVDWGVNVDAVAALETIASVYDLKPAMIAEIDPTVPEDLRPLPRELT
jgi:hypothetical protein